jgi:PhzF family phenazine biosynthesis protein
MPLPLGVVDAFTRERFHGNPAAVCLPGPEATAEWMQAVAAELNLSETAFATRLSPGRWHLRWFTPRIEVDLCGHATLAMAHWLWESGCEPASQVLRFETRSGPLECRPEGGDLGQGRIVMDFPAQPAQEIAVPDGLEAALGIRAVRVGRSREDLLVELATAEEVRSLRPNFDVLSRFPVRGVIVTAHSDRPDADFVSRFFAPAVGIDEDPVTGSAHCTLACHWSHQLGRTDLTGFQASARGGTVGVELRGERVRLLGHAVTAWRGEWMGDPGSPGASGAGLNRP